MRKCFATAAVLAAVVLMGGCSLLNGKSTLDNAAKAADCAANPASCALNALGSGKKPKVTVDDVSEAVRECQREARDRQAAKDIHEGDDPPDNRCYCYRRLVLEERILDVLPEVYCPGGAPVVSQAEATCPEAMPPVAPSLQDVIDSTCRTAGKDHSVPIDLEPGHWMVTMEGNTPRAVLVCPPPALG